MGKPIFENVFELIHLLQISMMIKYKYTSIIINVEYFNICFYVDTECITYRVHLCYYTFVINGN